MSNLSTITATPPSRHRFHVLDALRGLAALMVADIHTASLIGNKVLARNGHLAVDFFFCLSGFVIAFSYERRLLEGMSLRTFFTARMIRLYPMIFIAMTIGILKPLIMQLHHADTTVLKDKAVAYLHGITLIPDIGRGSNHFIYPLDNAAWSLFFELLANLAFAYFVIRRKVPTAFLIVTMALSLGFILLGVHNGIAVIAMGAESLLPHFLLGLPRVAFSFASGVLVLRLYRSASPAQHTTAANVLLGLAVATVLVFALLSPLGWMQSPGFELFTIVLLTPVLVFLGAFARVPDRLSGLCNLLGEISYPMYLLHIVLNYAFASAALALAARVPALRTPLLSLILTLDLVVAYCVGKWLDTPLRELAVRYFHKPPALVPANA